MEADTIPDLPKGSTARRIISHLVAPSASAASSCRRGVCMKISRDMEVIIGQNHNGEHHSHGGDGARRVGGRALEQWNEAQVVGNPVPERVDGRHQNQAAPQTVDNGRDGSQQIDHIAQRGGELLRRIMRNETAQCRWTRRRQSAVPAKTRAQYRTTAGARSPRSCWPCRR